MSLSNFERMIQMAEEVFDAQHDQQQIQVNEDVIAKLQRLHPSSVTELDEGNGPVVWILIIPTIGELMFSFLKGNITEHELLQLTPPDSIYDAIYLCSAMVLPEYRNKGMATKLTLQAIHSIRESHPIKYLFVWPFTISGENLAEKIAETCRLPLLKK